MSGDMDLRKSAGLYMNEMHKIKSCCIVSIAIINVVTVKHTFCFV